MDTITYLMELGGWKIRRGSNTIDRDRGRDRGWKEKRKEA